jgi:hypothetical protein
MTGTHAIQADPLFADAENNDFRLKENSPAANAGYSDLKDASRNDRGYSLGAFPVGTSKESFWWLANFPPEIDIKNYAK